MADEDDSPPPHEPSSASLAKDLPSPLTRIPLDVARHRQLIFALETPVHFDQKAWDKYWPYVDNIWCLHNKHDAFKHLNAGVSEKFWGGCRLARKWDHGEVNPEGRKRKRRETGQCQAKFRLTVLPNGIRVLERSGGEHSHDLDYIDSIKRNSGVRSLVTDPYFNSWEAAGILAYLRDPAQYIDGKDMLSEAGGKYLERREIINVYTQTLRKAYPGLDVTELKKQQDKYKSMKTCNFKGCNRAFTDSKELTAHRKAEHQEVRHDHSEKLYTCPCKTCHRRKRSKGFETWHQLREHQIRMAHWGSGTYHGDGGPSPAQAVSESDHAEESTIAEPSATTVPSSGNILDDRPLSQQQLPSADVSLLPSFQPGPMTSISTAADEDIVPIDPNMHPSVSPNVAMAPNNVVVVHQRQSMLQRLQALEMERARMDEEMQRLRSALLSG